ncbi:SbcC/MukB-like Walker B domain-containing protein [Sunxiuqinia indica]|uniref:SbcC/MukB-like Walker B domain-containing protein n=1 Tax=Sunxiuqinia indica TaxID=2692584 RepID=UPI00135ABE7E|nr:SMC family ATPase [Sunxiuqinia indica]
MIPVQLTIQGLYSYQEKQTIDFTKLTAASLFGIFGSVGSGKSSILEAITFAIYGKTDRLNLSGDNRNYNMMNLKSNELLIEFVFETGKDQTAYRAVVHGKRNSKRFDDVKKLDRSAYQKQDGSWFPIEPTALEQAIGLSYDNFKRTIIIPQGQFQEFLQLGNKDRTQMMKELFNLQKFELYYKVTALEGKNNARKQHLDGQLQQLGEIDLEQVKKYQEQLARLKKEMAEQLVKLTNSQKQEQEWKQLLDLTKKLEQTEVGLKALQSQEPEFKKLEQNIANYELCVMQFRHLFESLQASTKRIAQKEVQIKQDDDKLKREDEGISRLEKELKELKPVYEKRDELKQKADELERMIKIKDLARKVKDDQDRLKKGNEICDKLLEDVEKLKKEKAELEGTLKSDKAKLPDMAVLANAKAWHVEDQNLAKQLLEIHNQEKKYEDEIKTAKDVILKLSQNSLFDGLPEESDVSAMVKFLDDKLVKIKKELKLLEKEAGDLQLKERLKAFADGLTDGEPCPLCGSDHHPQIYSAESSHEVQQQLMQNREKREKEIEQISEQINRLKELDSHLKYTDRNLKEWAEKRTEVDKKRKVHQSGFKWEKYRDIVLLEKAFQESNLLQVSIKKKEAELEEFTKKQEKAAKDKERYQLGIDKIKTDLTVRQTEQKTLQEQLKLIDLVQYQHKPNEEVVAEQQQLMKDFTRLKEQFEKQSNLLMEGKKRKDILTGSLNASRKELEEEKQNHKKLATGIHEELKKTKFQSTDEVKEILAQSINLKQEKQKLADFKEQLVLSRKQQQQLQQEIGDRKYESEKHQALITEIGMISEQTKQMNQEFGKLTELLKKLQQDLESQGALRKELEALNLREENIRTMKSLFKASGFVNYISSVYLQNLCNAANDRFFQLTRQKLSLEITPDNNFQVRDFMNGGKVRSVKTLSGGQTFQAALSLALALADNIQKITESNQNFFFLDEGFGSLDKESLSIVFDTLKSLRKERRIVGVISHVEEMQQEIDVHLRIDNQSERGSLIHASWKE